MNREVKLFFFVVVFLFVFFWGGRVGGGVRMDVNE